jgi:hypothetical protein
VPKSPGTGRSTHFGPVPRLGVGPKGEPLKGREPITLTDYLAAVSLLATLIAAFGWQGAAGFLGALVPYVVLRRKG